MQPGWRLLTSSRCQVLDLFIVKWQSLRFNDEACLYFYCTGQKSVLKVDDHVVEDLWNLVQALKKGFTGKAKLQKKVE